MAGILKDNHISVDIEIESPTFKGMKKILRADIDTGFTNELTLPYAEAFPLGLTLVGIQEFVLADGKKVAYFQCLGLVTFVSKTVLCVISISESRSILIGMTLLKKLGCKMEVDFQAETVNITQPAPSAPKKSAP